MAAKGVHQQLAVVEDADDGAELAEEALTGSGKGHKSRHHNYVRVFLEMRACLLTVFLFWSCQWVDTDIAGGFYRSIMVCDSPVPSASGACPIGTRFNANACDPVGRGEVGWSGSAHCFDQEYVVYMSTQFGGRLSTLATIGQMLSSIFVGTTLIDTLGRKPVMVLALVGWFILCVMFTIVSHLQRMDMAPVLMASMLLVSICNSFSPAAVSMASDVSKADEVDRSVAMTMVMSVKNAGALVGFIVGFFILRSDPTDYSPVWTTLCIVVAGFCAIAQFTLRETLPVKRFSASCCINRCTGRRSRLGLGDVAIAMRMIWRDPYLRYTLLPSHFLNGAAAMGCMSMAGGWGISICKYPQEISSVMGIVQPSMILVGSLASSAMVVRWGPWAAGAVGGCAITWGFIITGLGAFFPSSAGVLWWIGFGGVAGFGQGICTPCINGISSTRLPSADQGKLFSISYLAAGLGGAIGLYIFSNYLFANGSENTQLEIASGWFVGAALMGVTLCINLLAYSAYILPEQNGAASTRVDRQRLAARPSV